MGKEENSYRFSPEELRCPETGVAEWFKERVDSQLEGIELKGLRPQLLRRLPEDIYKKWLKAVWRPYLKTLPKYEREKIEQTTGPGSESHTRKRRHVDR